jgi:hypothetical protein
MDIDAGHVSLASPLGRALGGKKTGEEVSLRLPTGVRRLRIVELVTVHQTDAGDDDRDERKVAKGNGKR